MISDHKLTINHFRDIQQRILANNEGLQAYYDAQMALVLGNIKEFGNQRLVVPASEPWGKSVMQYNDDLFANEYLQDDDVPTRSDSEEFDARLAAALDDVNGYLQHYGFPRLDRDELMDSGMERIAALLRHMEDTLTAPTPTRAQSSHPLYPEERK